MKQLLDQFKNLNPARPGQLAAAAQGDAAARRCSSRIAGRRLLPRLAGARSRSSTPGAPQEAKLKDEYVDKKQQAINLDLYRAAAAEIEQLVRRAAEAAAEQGRDGRAAVDINQAGLGRGLQFELFKPAPQRDVKDYYAELPITMKVTGRYHDIGAFASDVGQPVAHRHAATTSRSTAGARTAR